MSVDAFTDEVVIHQRRFLHLAVLRLSIVLGYVAVQTVAVYEREPAALSLFAGTLFAFYSAALLLYRRTALVKRSTTAILLIDLSVMVLLVLLTSGAELGVPLLMFYFLMIEAALLHGVKEVLILTSVSIVFYGAWLTGGEGSDFRFSFSSFMFMLVVGGALGYYFTFQAQRAERRISDRLIRVPGMSEPDKVIAAEEALRELALHMGCSRAVLAFWDPGSDYYAVVQHPPQRGPSDPPPAEFDNRSEWACMAGKRLEFHSNDVSPTDQEGKKISRDFDLHPYVIQRFEVYNAIGCGLYEDDRPIGRLLLINSVRGVRGSDYRRLQDIAPLFREAVRYVLTVRRAEHTSQERERVRIAHDLHDGPLQSIISFEMRLQIIRKLRERSPELAEQEFESLYDISHKMVSEMRTFVHRMRPIESEDSSLSASARRLVEGFQKESGVAVTIMGEQNGSLSVPGRLGGEVLKIAREALHNVYKHSQATHVLFSLEKKLDKLNLAIDDNGAGFRFGGRFTLEELDALQMGPRSIKQRVRSLGGDLTLESNPGQGANLRITVPLLSLRG